MILVVSAAFSEEILYRGFLIRYLELLTTESPTGLAFAVIASAVVCAAGHAYQGVWGATRALVLAILVGAIPVGTRSLWLPMALHFLIDLFGFYLGPRLLSGSSKDQPSTESPEAP